MPPRLPLQVRPAAHQPGAEVLQPRQLDLQLALVAAGALREDLQDQQRAVVDRQLHVALEVALLRRAERLVEQDFGGAGLLGQHLDLVGLAAADEQRRVGRLALAGDTGDRLQARGLGQQAQLFEFGIEMGQAQVDADQDRGREGCSAMGIKAGPGDQDGSDGHRPARKCAARRAQVAGLHRPRRPGSSRRGRERWWRSRACRPSASRYCAAARRIGRRLDLALQLDAVDQVDGHRNMLATQGVEEGVL